VCYTRPGPVAALASQPAPGRDGPEPTGLGARARAAFDGASDRRSADRSATHGPTSPPPTPTARSGPGARRGWCPLIGSSPLGQDPASRASSRADRARHVRSASAAQTRPERGRVAGWRRPPGTARPWAVVSWWYSLVLVVPLLGLVATVIARAADEPATIALTVTDAYTGQPLPGVAIPLAGGTLTTDDAGRIELEEPEAATTITVQRDGYAPAILSLTPDALAPVALALRPTTLTGFVTDAATGQPLADVAVAVAAPDGAEVTTTTGADGRYLLTDVPAEATLRLDGGDYGVVEEAVGTRTETSHALKLTTVEGRVFGRDGEPLADAIVTAGEATDTTKADGTFKLTGVSDGAEVRVVAAGYLDGQVALPAERRLELTLEPITIKAVYANQFALALPEKVDYLIDLIDRTELNALVVDIKQDTIFYDSQVPFFVEADTVVPLYDVDEILTSLHDRGIYAIARMVVFQDPLVAEAYPHLAVRDEVTGDLWRNYDGVAWVNAFNEELWHANVELALEAVFLGFDEIQFDYVRFPSDGDLTTSDFGREYTAEARAAAITGFVDMASKAIRPTGAKLAADLFAIIALFGNEQGIGQQYDQLVPLLDYVCLMAYPSHFITGNILSAPGHPNDYPYETVLETLQRAEELVPGSKLKARPWIQDFDYPGLADYGEAELRAQIQAAEDYGASGWMVWDPTTDYTVAAFDPA
jgi:hypothetical protein